MWRIARDQTPADAGASSPYHYGEHERDVLRRGSVNQGYSRREQRGIERARSFAVRTVVWALYSVAVILSLFRAFNWDRHHGPGFVAYAVVVLWSSSMVAGKVRPPKVLIWFLPLCVAYLLYLGWLFRSG